MSGIVQYDAPIGPLLRIPTLARELAQRAEVWESPPSLSRDLSWPPDMLEEVVPYRDSFGRGPYPTQLRARSFALLVPGLIQQFARRKVPDEMTSVDLDAAGYTTVSISCRCGQIHEVEIGGLASAACGRFFLWFGGDVMWALPGDPETPDCTCRTDAEGREYANYRCPRCYPS